MAGKGKRWLAIGLAVMIGCMIPVGTMKAAYEGPIKITFSNRDGADNIARSVNDPVDPGVEVCNNHDQAFVVTATGSFKLFYYLDTDSGKSTRSETDLADLCKSPVPDGGRIQLSKDGKYVLYVKAEAEGTTAESTTVYAGSSCRVVVDTQKPVIEGIEDQGQYPVGQTFTVKDDNDVTVTINEQIVSPDSAGKYTIQAQPDAGNYVIKATDIAGHESATVIVYLTDTTPKPEEPVNNTITEPKTYTLQEGTAYTLGAGSWKVVGDSSVYPGGITFYVPAGNYTFQKQ